VAADPVSEIGRRSISMVGIEWQLVLLPSAKPLDQLRDFADDAFFDWLITSLFLHSSRRYGDA
jgi:hypothetical protein